MNLSILQVFCAFFSGLLQSLSISNSIFPFGSPFIALFSLIPMYFAFYSAKTYRKAFLIFFIETITVHLYSSSWLANYHGFAIFTLGASAFGTGLLGGIVGLITHFFPAQIQKRHRFEENSGRRSFAMQGRILWFCASWIFWEWIKSTGILAYPWGTVSMAAYRWKIFTQIADITGVWGVSFLFVFFSAVTAEGLQLLINIRTSQNPSPLVISYRGCVKFTFTIFAICGLYGLYQYFIPRIPTKQLNTVIVQQNVDPWEAGDLDSITISSALTEKKINEMRENGDEPDLILWSEGTLNRLFPRYLEYYSQFPEEESLTDFIQRMNVPFIIGGTAIVDHYKRKFTNIAIMFDRRGTYAGFYSKMHLVPFAELIPLADNPLMHWFMSTVVKMPASLSEGKQTVIFKIPLKNDFTTGFEAPLDYNMAPVAHIELDESGVIDEETPLKYTRNSEFNPNAFLNFSTPICFEDAFPDVCRKLFAEGSEIFLNITNDSWSKTASAEYQHFIAASYLSIEFRTTLVRCCNSGYSAVLAPNGKILNSMDIFVEDAMGVTVPVYERKATVFAIYGDWFAYSIMFAMALYFAISTLKFHFEKKLPKIKLYIEIRKIIQTENNYEEKDSEIISLPHPNKDITFLKPIVPNKNNATEEDKSKSGDKPVEELKAVKKVSRTRKNVATDKKDLQVLKTGGKVKTKTSTAADKKSVKTEKTVASKKTKESLKTKKTESEKKLTDTAKRVSKVSSVSEKEKKQISKSSKTAVAKKEVSDDSKSKLREEKSSRKASTKQADKVAASKASSKKAVPKTKTTPKKETKK